MNDRCRACGFATWDDAINACNYRPCPNPLAGKRQIHYLKTVEPYYSQVANGEKTFELRQYTAQGPLRPARDFAIGDVLRISPDDGEGTIIERRVSYILKDTDPCMEGRLAPGYCILGLAVQVTHCTNCDHAKKLIEEEIAANRRLASDLEEARAKILDIQER